LNFHTRIALDTAVNADYTQIGIFLFPARGEERR